MVVFSHFIEHEFCINKIHIQDSCVLTDFLMKKQMIKLLSNFNVTKQQHKRILFHCQQWAIFPNCNKDSGGSQTKKTAGPFTVAYMLTTFPFKLNFLKVHCLFHHHSFKQKNPFLVTPQTRRRCNMLNDVLNQLSIHNLTGDRHSTAHDC